MSYEVQPSHSADHPEVEEGQTITGPRRCATASTCACCRGVLPQTGTGPGDGGSGWARASPFALMDVERDDNKCLAPAAPRRCRTSPSGADIDRDPDESGACATSPGRVAEVARLRPTIRACSSRFDEIWRFRPAGVINEDSQRGSPRGRSRGGGAGFVLATRAQCTRVRAAGHHVYSRAVESQ